MRNRDTAVTVHAPCFTTSSQIGCQKMRCSQYRAHCHRPPSFLTSHIRLSYPFPMPSVRPVQRERADFLASAPPLPGLAAPPAEGIFQWPLAAMRREIFHKGDCLFKAGDKADRMFYIHRGAIWLPEIKKRVTEGQVVGEMGIFSPRTERTASAFCEEELETYTMGREEVMQFFSRDPSVAINLIQLSFKRFIENVKAETEAKERIRSELRIAHDIQMSMLPRSI